jgi:hypothetical protein
MTEFDLDKITNYTVKCNKFGTRYYYFEDNNVRIRLGFSLRHLGKTYYLQRKNKHFWRTVAWTYYFTHEGNKFAYIVEYLFWFEKQKNK